MDLLFFIVLIAAFAIGSVALPRVGGEGERDLMDVSIFPPVPQHHA